MKKRLTIVAFILCLCVLTGCQEAPPVTEAEGENVPVIPQLDPTIQQSEPAIGGSMPDTVFTVHFYELSARLEPLIEMDRFPEWQEYHRSLQQPEDDPYLHSNIYELIRFFDIPREDFENRYYTSNLYYLVDYNFDLLYGDDKEAVYEYYKTYHEDFTKRNTEQTIKQILMFDYIGQEKFLEWLGSEGEETGENYSETSWGIAEAIYAFDIPRMEMENIVIELSYNEEAAVISEVYEDGTEVVVADGTVPIFEYDWDMVYENNAELLEAIEAGVPGYQLDEMIRK